MEDRLKLQPGETVEFVGLTTKGFMEETDVSTYSIVDASRAIVGSVVYTVHTAVNGFRSTHSVVQRDASGAEIFSDQWQLSGRQRTGA